MLLLNVMHVCHNLISCYKSYRYGETGCMVQLVFEFVSDLIESGQTCKSLSVGLSCRPGDKHLYC